MEDSTMMSYNHKLRRGAESFPFMALCLASTAGEWARTHGLHFQFGTQ